MIKIVRTIYIIGGKMDINIEKVLNNLEKNNIKPIYLETNEEVAGAVSQLLNEGDTVAIGGISN